MIDVEREAYSCRHGLCPETEKSPCLHSSPFAQERSPLGLSSSIYILFASPRSLGMHLYSRHLAQNCGFKGNGRRSVGLSCESGLGVEHTAPLVSRCLQGCRAPSSSEDRALQRRGWHGGCASLSGCEKPLNKALRSGWVSGEAAIQWCVTQGKCGFGKLELGYVWKGLASLPKKLMCF